MVNLQIDGKLILNVPVEIQPFMGIVARKTADGWEFSRECSDYMDAVWEVLEAASNGDTELEAFEVPFRK